MEIDKVLENYFSTKSRPYIEAVKLQAGYPCENWRGLSVTRQDSLETWARDKARIRAQGIAARTGQPVTDPTSGNNR